MLSEKTIKNTSLGPLKCPTYEARELLKQI